MAAKCLVVVIIFSVCLVTQIFVVSGILLDSFGYGAAHGFLAVLNAQFTDDQGRPLSATDISWIGAVLGMAQMMGVLMALALMSRFGRHKAVLTSNIPAITSWVIYCTCNSVPLFIMARILQGIALGVTMTAASNLIAEYTHPALRGISIGGIAPIVGLGMWFSHVLGAALSWRIAALICALIHAAALVIIALSPESPSWLASHGRIEEARKTWLWLRGDSAEDTRELEGIIQNAKSMERKVCWKSLRWNFTNAKMFYIPTFVSICVHIAMEFSGNHMVGSYGDQILRLLLAKPDLKDVSWLLSAFSILRVAATFLGLILLKYFRRRVILFTSGTMTIASYSIISLFIFLRRADLVSPYLLDATPMCLFFFYVVSLSLLQPSSYAICGEVFPLAYRSLGPSVAICIYTPSSAIAMKSAPILYASVGLEGSFLIFAGVLVVCLGAVYPLLPETKDRTLEDIENSFRGKKKNERVVETTSLRVSEIVVNKN